ncbi:MULTISPECIES: hypothetical protein [unclassified Sphingobium]|uniref:hypothetical protein n=1 Tax=unclassified Sphingobium TaxID=2611147 RepID=UPI001C0F37DC|nr:MULTISPECIES: hypothetical protein [unclassified Sphingobium]
MLAFLPMHLERTRGRIKAHFALLAKVAGRSEITTHGREVGQFEIAARRREDDLVPFPPEKPPDFKAGTNCSLGRFERRFEFLREYEVQSCALSMTGSVIRSYRHIGPYLRSLLSGLS